MEPYVRRVFFYETDGMQIVHHSNYIRWMEEARIDLMAQMGYGYERATAEGIDIAVLGIQCDYKSMVRFGETVVITAQITTLTPTRMSIGYNIKDQASGILRLTGESQHCYIKNSKPVSLRKKLPELYECFAANI